MKNLSIYIHIPFCQKKCKYCDFNSVDGATTDVQRQYLYALTKEIKQNKQAYKDYNISTVFIGGGTPSFLFKGAVATLLSAIKSNYNLLPTAEITLESNPNSITAEKVQEWKSAGINRVSVGLQSASKSLLKTLGRSHTLQQYKSAMQLLKNIGLTNINTDLMIGLPGQKQSQIKRAIQVAHAAGSTHISCYTLILEKNTPLELLVRQNIVKMPKEERVVDAYFFSVRYLKKLGYSQYEVSNFALDNYACQHNLNCWNLKEYVGFGAGAHSFINGKRYNNTADLTSYIAQIKTSQPVKENEEVVDDNWLEEYIILAMRTSKGMDLQLITDRCGIDFLKQKKAPIDLLLAQKLVQITDGYLSSTPKGFIILNYIISKLLD